VQVDKRGVDAKVNGVAKKEKIKEGTEKVQVDKRGEDAEKEMKLRKEQKKCKPIKGERMLSLMEIPRKKMNLRKEQKKCKLIKGERMLR